MKKTLAIATIILLSGCSTRPIMDHDTNRISSQLDGTPYSAELVRGAILLGVQDANWEAYAKGNNTIGAELKWKRYSIDVNIKYNSQSFTIDYVDSENLGYDGIKIHRAYNNQLQRLRTHIKHNLSSRSLERYKQKLTVDRTDPNKTEYKLY